MLLPCCAWSLDTPSSPIEVAQPVSLKRLAVSLPMGDGTQQFALLLAAPHDSHRVTEWQDRQQFEVGRDLEERLDFLQPTEANPVGGDPVGPGRQQHRLDRTARV